MTDLVPLRTALLSVSDKTDLVPFVQRLESHGVRVISTGGTARKLADAGIAVTAIETVTGFPEMMDGRVKTLHPRVHGGLLALRDKPDHAAAMEEHGIAPIDLVCVNLYPFETTIADQTREGQVNEEEAIEQIDIGGPAMIRSASKNFRYVCCVTSARQYDRVSNELEERDGHTSLRLRQELAAAAFRRTAEYDTTIAGWMANLPTASAPAEAE